MQKTKKKSPGGGEIFRTRPESYEMGTESLFLG